jgi:dienelactone hydrolase
MCWIVTRFELTMRTLAGLLFAALVLAALPVAGREAATPYRVVHFPSGDLTLEGELYVPKGRGPFPAVLYNHGSAAGMASDAASTAMGPLYAAKGWVYFMPYRRGQGLSAHAGMYIGDQIEAADKQGGHEAAVKTMIRLLTGDHLDDQLAALAWLKSQDFIQVNRIAVAGQSFGGIEVILGAKSYPFCAAVDASGGAMSWDDAPDLHALMKESAANSKTPTLFFQAENDFTLAPSFDLYNAMIAAGKDAQIKIYPPFGRTPFDGHSFTWLGESIWFDDVLTFIESHCR